MKIIESDRIPAAAGHYSMCLAHNGILYVSGQLPKREDGTIPDGIEPQTRLVLDKLKVILEEGGSALQQVLQVRVYITDVGLWGTVNEIYAQYFGSHKPARCIVPVPELHYGALLELECIASTT
ncbi:MAG: RidA family protein [Saprospiraceae bacterium]|nr:RidA family protein [Saprospiraceae bacterium]